MDEKRMDDLLKVTETVSNSSFDDKLVWDLNENLGHGFQILDASKAIGAGAATIALAGVGVGIGIVFNGMLNSFGRNPRLKDELFRVTILGFALTEAIGLFALLMAFLIFFS